MGNLGYSGTPLERKLGLKTGMAIRLVNEPTYYLSLFSEWPEGLLFTEETRRSKDFIHYFTTRKEELMRDLSQLAEEIKVDGMLWISWPKQAAKTDTDLNGNIVRKLGLDQGLVDVKVCAVDATWSALKFVIPVKDRQ